MKQRRFLTVDEFFPDAGRLRKEFEERFENPREARPDRFVWDYWHVPGQYTQLRTPAYHFFSKKRYEAFHNQLVWWGRRNLGCHDISPPWMSCYIEGCGQQLHADLPHGPWAYVFSLTPWKGRKFSGGETLLIREGILDYWRNPTAPGKGLEQEDVFERIPALFNRLTVFDPRIPHGVSQVQGVQDVTEGRLVIHGWFVQPRPFIEGPLPARDLQKVIDDLSGVLGLSLASGIAVQGVLSLGFSISPSGQVGTLRALSNALRSLEPGDGAEARILKDVSHFLKNVRFKKMRAPSQVTLPLVFEV